MVIVNPSVGKSLLCLQQGLRCCCFVVVFGKGGALAIPRISSSCDAVEVEASGGAFERLNPP